MVLPGGDWVLLALVVALEAATLPLESWAVVTGPLRGAFLVAAKAQQLASLPDSVLWPASECWAFQSG